MGPADGSAGKDQARTMLPPFERGFIAHLIADWMSRNKIGTIGIPWPDTDARIVDPLTGDEEMPMGETVV